MLLPLWNCMLSYLYLACSIHSLPCFFPVQIWCCDFSSAVVLKLGTSSGELSCEALSPPLSLRFPPILYIAQVKSGQNRLKHLWPNVVKQKSLCLAMVLGSVWSEANWLRVISNKELIIGILPCKILVTGKTVYVGLLLFARLLPGISRADTGKGKMVAKRVRASASWNPCGQGRTHAGVTSPLSLWLC